MSDILLSEKAGRDAHLLRHAIRSGETVAAMSSAQFNDLSAMNEAMFKGAAQIEYFPALGEQEHEMTQDEEVVLALSI